MDHLALIIGIFVILCGFGGMICCVGLLHSAIARHNKTAMIADQMLEFLEQTKKPKIKGELCIEKLKKRYTN